MKIKTIAKISAPIAIVFSLTGCVTTTTQGDHTYVNGKCITCFNNPLTGEPANYENEQLNTNSEAATTASCGTPKSKYDNVYHRADKRWCSNLTLPGAKWSNEIKHSELVKQGVDMAYINAKKLLQFLDADDKPQQYRDKAQIDSIPSTYYSVTSRYGGPVMQLDWMADYQLELKRVSKTTTRVTIKYKTYSKDMNPAEFQQRIINVIKEG